MAQLTCKNLTLGYDNRAIQEDLNFSIDAGDYLCIVGENGSGKSTLMKTLLHLQAPISGSIELGDGLKKNEIGYLPQQTLVQRDFPASVREIVLSGCQNHLGFWPFYRTKEKKYAEEMMKKLQITHLSKRCYRELSGGQQQRVMIAMAIACEPRLLIADEPTTALDVVVQKGILMMLMRLQKQLKNTMIIVSHDMGVHYQITDRMAIMYSGSVAELGKTEDIFNDPIHPYTKMLVDALPRVGEDVQRVGIAGRPPALKNPPPGCRFAPRCPHATDRCRSEVPKFREIKPGRFAACHLLEEEVKTNG